LQIITSINPSPRTEIDENCDEFYQKPIEKIDLILFEKLKSGDIVFFDNSHRLFSNSEITVMFPDVLPGYRSAPPVIGYG
jgi:Holliday junction resolvasome RuvABC ATP-dependent DNA helicase subunit